MPVALTYPGVYVEEIPSGVHTITGVATSIAAFIGRAARGPVNEATTITSYADFERQFGGIWPSSLLGYAVQDFYNNGGGQAIIVRLYHPGAGATLAKIVPGGLPLAAANEGVWANNLLASVDHVTDPSVAADLGVLSGDIFNLTVIEAVDASAASRIAAAPANIQAADVRTSEVHRNLTVKDSARRFDRVLAAASNLVAADVATPYVAPAQPGDAQAVQPTTPAVADLPLTPADFLPAAPKQGLFALDDADLFNILCIPPYDSSGDLASNLIGQAAAYCEKRRAIFILDSPTAWTTANAAVSGFNSGIGTASQNAAVFFPRYQNPSVSLTAVFPVCGAVAGVFARTDSNRGVWKAPAGLEATLLGVPRLTVPLTDEENGLLNPLGVNCLRNLPPAGTVVWGSRTLQGADSIGSEWKYIPVRRIALFIEESLYRGTKWVVFEPNDEPLWAQIRLNVGAFMNGLFRQGAFKGKTPADAYFVKCDKETTTQQNIDNGIVNIVVGFAPLKPAEFVIIQIQQLSGQLAV